MIRTILLAAGTLLFAATAAPATAQSISQSGLQARYDRALAAGYKAMFLCSATANAERADGMRTPDHILQWELTGIQAPLNALMDELPFEIHRNSAPGEGNVLSHVTVDWSDQSPPRLAYHREEGGCAIAPIGTRSAPDRGPLPVSRSRAEWAQPEIQESRLAAIVQSAFGIRYGQDARTTAIIVQNASGEELSLYRDGFSPYTPQRTWSVAKSIAATIVGAAIYRGEADVNDSAGLGESDADPRRAITIDHGLRMATGRYSDTPGNRTDALYFGGSTVDEVAVDWPLVNAPGTIFRYANNDTLIAQQAIEHTFADHPPADLFDRVGMTGTVAETDWQGNYILSSQVWATAPDLMRLGQLYLNDGVLPDGTRILAEGWVEYISSPTGPQPGGSRGWGYGAGWWLFNNSEGIPADTFFAAGNRGQYIVVIPGRNVVIVRRGEDPAGGSGFDIAAFTRDVLAALDE